MKTWLNHAWNTLTSGYWFVPGTMTIGAAALGFGMVAVDGHLVANAVELGWVYGGGADGARALLSAVASSAITVAGVVFSITVAALTQASSQFGPRLLRSFMRDTRNQVVLGTFVSTFVFCLLALRAVHGGDPGFVPHASVTVAVILAVACIAVLIFFIHHVSRTLQAPLLIARVSAELTQAIQKSAQAMDARVHHSDCSPATEGFDDPAVVVRAPRDGYIQAADIEALVSLAKERGVVIKLPCRPGDFVIERAPLALISTAEGWDPAADARARDAFIIGRERTDEQDIEYSVRQIVEVAVRALSPGINDPFTAMNGIDALGAGVCRAARHGLPGPHRFDDQGILRVVASVTTFDGLVDAAFNQIRQYGRDSVSVTLRLLEVLASSAAACDAAQREVLLRHARMTYAQFAEVTAEEHDRADVRRRYEVAERALQTAGAE